MVAPLLGYDWLYQYYNTEPKDKVFANLKKNVKISAADIPAATQLFTPDWIVRYMVENSLGRLWTEGHGKPENADWKYYLEEAEQEDAVRAELKQLRESYREIPPEQIRIIDPCMGSGHILVYAFDVLMDIYTACGWSERDAAVSILRNNLYGLDIDRRAYQLAYFAVMMKARQYNRRILRGENQPNLANFADVMGVDTSMLGGSLRQFVEQFQFADTYGSLMTVTAPAGLDEMVAAFRPTIGLDEVQLEMMMRINKIISQKYDVVCTNPPYMGSSGMNAVLSDYVKKNYPDSKSDLFACFMETGLRFAKKNGYNCMVTMQSWMFLSSFEKMREKLLTQYTITNLMHMENMVMGIAFGTAVSIFRKGFLKGYKGTYNQIKLQDVENGKPTTFPVMNNRFAQVSSTNFSKIPGSPVAYWVSENFVRAFENPKIGDYALARNGMKTGDNGIYVRLWWESIDVDVCFHAENHIAAIESNKKWYPYNKGGEYRKWYGNNEYVVNWENAGKKVIGRAKEEGRHVQDYPIELKFKPLVTWSLITSSVPSFRYKESCINDIAGMSYWDIKGNNMLMYMLGICNTKIATLVLNMIAPTINFQTGDISRIPVIKDDGKKSTIDNLVEENISLSKIDWDSFETSWDFERHPLV